MRRVIFTKLVQWLIPVWMRSEVMIMLILASNYPLRELQSKFENYVDEVDYRFSKNYQVCYLQAMLNDKFDAIQRRIRIVDFIDFGTVWLYDDGDNLDVNIGNDIYLDDEDTGYDFTVQLPSTIVTTEAELARLRANMNLFKLYGKNYFIQRV